MKKLLRGACLAGPTHVRHTSESDSVSAYVIILVSLYKDI